MSSFEVLIEQLKLKPKAWLVSGVAGFIGSNLLEALLKLNQSVVGLDNLSTGYMCNLEEVKGQVSKEQWQNFTFIEGDICDLNLCHRASKGVDFVLHHAALGSVPRSLEDPISTNQNNVDGFLNMLLAARDAKVRRFVYAASSSTYGDHPDLPKVESNIGAPLSPYAVTKLVNELYANVFARSYGCKSVGLRYFNVFGARQDPEGAYAAVIPKWISALIKNDPVYINGDGETTRDFCYIDNVVQANLLAATTVNEDSINQIYNIAVADSISLNKLYSIIENSLEAKLSYFDRKEPIYCAFRAGDVRHSLADISKAQHLLGYQPSHRVDQGIEQSLEWYLRSSIRKVML